MNHQVVLTFYAAALAVVFVFSDAAPTEKGALVKFYPISRAQYNAILGLTEDKPVISEARLVSSGFRPFSELRTAIANDITTGWQQLLNATGVEVYYEKPSDNRVEGFPLCVIKTVDLEEADDDDDDHSHRYDYDGYKGRSAPQAAVESAGKKDMTSTAKTVASRGRGQNYYDAAHNRPHNANEDKDRPVINCIVVMKPKRPENSDDYDSHEHNHNHKKRRGHNNRRRYGHGHHAYQTKNNPIYAEFVDNQMESLEEEDKKSTATPSGDRIRPRGSSEDYYEYLHNFYRHQQPYGSYPYNPYFNPYAHGRQFAYPPFDYADRRDNSEEEADYH